MQSVPITTNIEFESLLGKVYSIQHYVIKFVRDLETGFLRFPPSMIHSFTVTFGAKYLTGMVTSVPLYETFSLIKDNIISLKTTKMT